MRAFKEKKERMAAMNGTLKDPTKEPRKDLHGTTTTVECAAEVFKKLDARKTPENAARLKHFNEMLQTLANICRPAQSELKFKTHICSILADALKKDFPEATLCRSGSMVNLLGACGSDVDLVLVHDEDDDEVRYNGEFVNIENDIRGVARNMLQKMAGVLRSKPFVAKAEYIDAKVPIIQVELKFPYNGIKIDISYNKTVGVRNSHLLFYYGRIDPRIPALIMLAKLWGRVRGVVDSRWGKLNSYTVTLMVIHYLQCVVTPPIAPNLMDDRMVDKSKRKLFAYELKDPVSKLRYDLPLEEYVKPAARNHRGLGELLYGFFEYYGEHFDYARHGISIREARIFNRAECLRDEHKKYCFFLEEPYERREDGGMPSALKNFTDGYVLEQMQAKFRDSAGKVLIDMVGGA